MKQYVEGRSEGHLVNSVESGVARVELDGGKGGLTGRSSGISDRGSDSRSSNSGHSRGSDSGSSNSRSSGVSQSWHSGESGVVKRSAGNGKSGEVKSGSVGIGESSDGGSSDGGSSDSLISVTSLPLSGSNLSSLEGSKVGSLGLSDLGGVLDWLGGDSGEDGSNKRLGVEGGGDQRLGLGHNRDGGADWEVGASNSESVDGVSDIVDSLEKTVSVNVLVRTSGHTVGIAGLQPEISVPIVTASLTHLSTSRWTASMSERELSELILSVELG